MLHHYIMRTKSTNNELEELKKENERLQEELELAKLREENNRLRREIEKAKHWWAYWWTSTITYPSYPSCPYTWTYTPDENTKITLCSSDKWFVEDFKDMLLKD